MRLIRWLVMIVAAALALFGLLQAAYTIASGSFIRPASLAWNPNVLAVVMIGGALCAARFRRPLLLWLCIITLAITLSRAGYIAALAALLTLKVMGASPQTPGKVEAGRSRLWSHHFLWGGLVAIGLSIIALRTAQPDSLLLYRLQLWRLALTIIRNNPAGIGYAGVNVYLSAHDSVTPEALHAHNLWLEVTAAWGLWGMIALACVVIFAGAISRRTTYGLAFLAALLTDGLFDFIWWAYPMALLIAAQFWTLIEARSSRKPVTTAKDYDHSNRKDSFSHKLI